MKRSRCERRRRLCHGESVAEKGYLRFESRALPESPCFRSPFGKSRRGDSGRSPSRCPFPRRPRQLCSDGRTPAMAAAAEVSLFTIKGKPNAAPVSFSKIETLKRLTG